MKKGLILFLLLLGLHAHAQVLILNDSMFQTRMTEIKATVVDSLTNEPVPFASVYVIPAKDTTITNFTLSNDKGEAKLEEVPLGQYTFHVEMMGYKPFVKDRYFRERITDFGTIRLQQDDEYLQAAVINDVGNPIVVKKDTVEFNASSFRVGSNAMLKDLLQRMPGMEITDDGKVKFNGEEIDKITIGGRTFFFNDQSTALNNLPAAVVDKVRVIDRDSEQTRATGIQDGKKEKILDVGLKKEYEKGWFGNVGVKGGSTVAAAKADEPLRDNRGFLYSGNALVSAYNEKDQVTVIGNVQNVADGNGVFIVYGDDGPTAMNQGLSSAAQLAVNANTNRIKDVESTVAVNYKYTDTDSGSKSYRTTYQDDGNLVSESEDSGTSFGQSVTADLEFKKEKGKVIFFLYPTFRYTDSFSRNGGSTTTRRGLDWLNNSTNASSGQTFNRLGNLGSGITFRELWGKKNRSLRFELYTNYSTSNGNSSQLTSLEQASGMEKRELDYVSKGKSFGINGLVRYTEPLGEKLTLTGTLSMNYNNSDRQSDAFDAVGFNAYYSSLNRSRSMTPAFELNGQYRLTQGGYFTLGARVHGSQNRTYSQTFGIEETTGEGEWFWFVSPVMRFVYNKDKHRVTFYANGSSSQPQASRMLPVLNVGNASRLSVGNIYLRPSGTLSFSADWNRNDREKFSTLMVYLFGQLNIRSVGNAQWYDKGGILYSIPANMKAPSFFVRAYANFTTPLDSKKWWSLSVSGGLQQQNYASFLSRGALPGLDKDNFDYTAFMADFWGNADGDRFYGGESGFEENVTRDFSPQMSFSLRYNREKFSISAGMGASGHIARSSLTPSADMNTLNMYGLVRGSYVTPHAFELSTNLRYTVYKGYAAGYDRPELGWDAEVSKNIGAFTLSLKAFDILNQTRGRSHTVTANYEEDSYRLVMGRYVLFGVKWNFGKMNAAQSQRAQQAAWKMVW